MADALSFDTTFLIDIQREHRAGMKGPAHALVEAEADSGFWLSAVALGEFAAGFPRDDHPVLSEVRRHFRIVPIDEDVALVYRRLFRVLKEQGALIGGNDLWIAAAAIHCGTPLATRNVDEFRRVPGLRIVAYA
jgi:tRNA(fMet)-specific endonuclease VapC